jgi:hypothetical protein
MWFFKPRDAVEDDPVQLHVANHWRHFVDVVCTCMVQVAILMIFDGLTAHPITNPLLDGPLFHLPTQVRVVVSQLTPSLIPSLMVLSSACRPGSELFSLGPLLMFNASTLLLVCGLLCVLIQMRTPRTFGLV